MKKLVVAVLVILAGFVSVAHGETCATVMQDEVLKLIATPVHAKSATLIPGNIVILTVETPPQGEFVFGDSLVPVTKQYEPEVFGIIQGVDATKSIWVGVREDSDGHGDPALWMVVFVQTKHHCVVSHVGDRVFEQRANAPGVFWSHIQTWEEKHPKSALYHEWQLSRLCEKK